MSAPIPRQMKLNRNYTLDSLYGHSIRFVKDVPVNVPRILYSQALAIGAEFVDGAGLEVVETKGPTAPTDPAERAELILMAVKDVFERNDTADFTAAGLPRDAAVEKILGFTVSSKERATAVQTYRDALEKARQEAAGNA